MLFKLLVFMILYQFYEAEEICCVPDQFEGTAYLGYGNVFIDKNVRKRRVPQTLASYINGTIQLAYDYTNRRSYLRIVGTEVSPLLPKPTRADTTFINDFKVGIQFQIDGNGKCQKSSLGNMTKQCVLTGGKEVVYGFLAGGNAGVANYEFHIGGSLPSRVTAAVMRDGDVCWPIRANYIPGPGVEKSVNEPGSGIMYNFEVIDTSRRIKDPSIFAVPSACKSKIHTQKTTGVPEKLRLLLSKIGFLIS